MIQLLLRITLIDWASRSPFAGEFEVVIMIEVCDRRDAWVELSFRPETDYERAFGWYGRTFNESEMARSSECTEQYAQKVLDTGSDIVRDAMLRQQPH